MDVGRNVVAKIKSGIDNNNSQLKSAADTAVGKVEKPFNDKNWTSIGSNIASGIAKGIRDNQSKITSAAKDAANAAYDAAKNELGISSPSKIFAKGVGRWIPEGIAQGVRDYADVAVRAVAGLAGTLADSAELSASELASGDFSPGGGQSGGYTQNITVNSPKALSPWEIARQTRNATRGMILAVRGV